MIKRYETPDVCDSLTSVTIPKSVTEIREKVFGWWFVPSDPLVRYKKEDFKIFCYAGTAGERYAKNLGFDYELIDE